MFLKLLKRRCYFLAAILLRLIRFFLADDTIDKRIVELYQNEDIRMTWQKEHIRMCLEADKFQGNPKREFLCRRKFIGYEQLDYEILNFRPAILKISRFLMKRDVERIEEHFEKLSSAVESQGVEGHQYNNGYRGRRADGLWVEPNQPIIRTFYQKLQRILRLNPAFAENFLILNYEKMGHYAIHFDHLMEMLPEEDDGWFRFFGNRMATALLLLRIATEGGATIFPRLNLAIQPEIGDLILWMNADSNDEREELALHAACPILQGEKMAVSLWIRGHFQDSLQTSDLFTGYQVENLIRDSIGEFQHANLIRERPPIPNSVFE